MPSIILDETVEKAKSLLSQSLHSSEKKKQKINETYNSVGAELCCASSFSRV